MANMVKHIRQTLKSPIQTDTFVVPAMPLIEGDTPIAELDHAIEQGGEDAMIVPPPLNINDPAVLVNGEEVCA